MKIDCLMGTYGRHSLACEALACFLQQSMISDATLLIYNQHPTPLFFDHPRVRVVNESGRGGSLRHIRQRMHELADPSADLIHWWDDDDLYLPWHLEDCLRNIGDAVAWKPMSSWMSMVDTEFSRHANTFEGSWVFRAEYLKRAPIDTHPTYSDHPVIWETLDAGLLATTELGDMTSYIYRWQTGAEHVSAYPQTGSEKEQEANIVTWRRRSTDVDPTGLLVPADLSLRWRQYLSGIRQQVSEENWNFISSKLPLNPPQVEVLTKEPASELDIIPTRSRFTHFEAIGDEILVFHSGRGRTTHLNSAASVIFGLCDGQRTILEIAAEIEARFPDAGADVAADVLLVVHRLREEGIFV